MDTLSHGLAGSVLSRAFTDRPEARAAFWVGAIAAMVPDLDVIFLSSRIEYLRDHRSWTHSFIVLPLLALLIALAAKAMLRRAPLSTLWLVSALGLASHIVFDWVTSFGEMFWTPISRHRYQLDWVFILDRRSWSRRSSSR
jgi:inner membrane protein